VEDDPYFINQFGHPYQGATYHLFARSAGIGYWRSSLYTFTGSVMWEIAGETTTPSVNDQVASGIAGSFFGEGLYRLARLILTNGGSPPSRTSSRWAMVAAPPASFNRRFDREATSNRAPVQPAYHRRLQLGAATTAHSALGATRDVIPNEAIVEGAIEYGLPGQQGYTYTKPFDHFTMQATASSANGFESILTKGLLSGRAWSVGERARGVAGIYGSHDYIAPQLFRVSITALTLGTTGQWWLTDGVALQANASAGGGYAAVGTNRGEREGDYKYGIAPQVVVGGRLIVGDDAAVEIGAREYYVSDVLANSSGAHDNIARAAISATFRLWRQNGVAVKYLWSRRDANYPDLGARTQVRGTIGVFYTLLGHDRFGAPDWRNTPSRGPPAPQIR
jgi:hypothetical protein